MVRASAPPSLAFWMFICFKNGTTDSAMGSSPATATMRADIRNRLRPRQGAGAAIGANQSDCAVTNRIRSPSISRAVILPL